MVVSGLETLAHDLCTHERLSGLRHCLPLPETINREQIYLRSSGIKKFTSRTADFAENMILSSQKNDFQENRHPQSPYKSLTSFESTVRFPIKLTNSTSIPHGVPGFAK